MLNGWGECRPRITEWRNGQLAFALPEQLKKQSKQLLTSPVHILELRELESKLAGAIAKLPSKMQTVYVLSRHGNLSYREIANGWSIAETTVKKQVRMLKVIRAEVGGIPAATLLFIISLFD